MISQLMTTGVTLALLTMPASFSQTSPTNPTPSNLERDLVVLPSERASNQPVILAGYHDGSGNWVWGDGSVERCYNWSTGYYC
jgi:prepilin-type processing-associated H-X9-DG protein